jgi:hypothetical protein
VAGSLGLGLESPGFPPLPPAGPGAYELYITCFSTDRASYALNSNWTGTLVIANLGDAPSPAGLAVYTNYCRFMQDGATFECRLEFDPLPEELPSLDPGESALLTTRLLDFSRLARDPDPTYESARDGIPDHGTVFIAFILENEHSVFVQAVYPAGPAAPDPAAPEFIDQDGDSWPVPPTSDWMYDYDCDDSNAEINPWHPEIVGNYLDDDCSGGDVPVSADCPYLAEVYHEGLPAEGPCRTQPGSAASPIRDLDGDGYFIYDPSTPNPPGLPDCNDLDEAMNPGEPERFDGLDNNCNGLVDEGFVTPDWVIEDFSLTRVDDFYEPDYYFLGLDGAELNLPGLRYSVQVGNAGQGLGDDLAAIQAVAISIPLVYPEQVVAVGTEGFIPYNSLPDGAEYACGSRGLVARIADGIFGEIQDDNNIGIASLPAVTAPDLDLRFSDSEPISVRVDDSLLLVEHDLGAAGSCPPLPQLTLGNRVFHYGVRIILNDLVLADEVHILADSRPGLPDLGTDQNAGTTVSLPAGGLEPGDLVCVEVTLDPDHLVTEIDRGNNMAVRVFEYRDPFLGPPRFDLIEALDGPPGAVDYGPGGCNPPAEAEGALASGGGWVLGGGLAGLVLLGLLGGLGGRWIVRATGLGGRLAGFFLAGTALTGALAGLLAGAALVDNLYIPRPASLFAAIQPADEAARPPACDTILDPASLLPADGAAFAPFAADLVVHLASQEGAAVPDRYLLRVSPPEGDPLILALASEGGVAEIRLGEEVYRQGNRAFFTQAGEYRWEVIEAQGHGPDEGAYLGLCQGSAPRTLTIDPALAPVVPTRTPTPTNTPTASPRPLPPTPSHTPSAVTPQDAAGPGIKNVSDAPDPIYAGAPKGCSPTTAAVSAVISDPSGVQSAVVLYIGASAGSAPMGLSGGTWQAVLGPFPAAGTVSYQVRAYDSLGNRSDTAFYPLTVLACIP